MQGAGVQGSGPPQPAGREGGSPLPVPPLLLPLLLLPLLLQQRERAARVQPRGPSRPPALPRRTRPSRGPDAAAAPTCAGTPDTRPFPTNTTRPPSSTRWPGSPSSRWRCCRRARRCGARPLPLLLQERGRRDPRRRARVRCQGGVPKGARVVHCAPPPPPSAERARSPPPPPTATRAPTGLSCSTLRTRARARHPAPGRHGAARRQRGSRGRGRCGARGGGRAAQPRRPAWLGPAHGVDQRGPEPRGGAPSLAASASAALLLGGGGAEGAASGGGGAVSSARSSGGPVPPPAVIAGGYADAEVEAALAAPPVHLGPSRAASSGAAPPRGSTQHGAPYRPTRMQMRPLRRRLRGGLAGGCRRRCAPARTRGLAATARGNGTPARSRSRPLGGGGRGAGEDPHAATTAAFSPPRGGGIAAAAAGGAGDGSGPPPKPGLGGLLRPPHPRLCALRLTPLPLLLGGPSPAAPLLSQTMRGQPTATLTAEQLRGGRFSPHAPLAAQCVRVWQEGAPRLLQARGGGPRTKGGHPPRPCGCCPSGRGGRGCRAAPLLQASHRGGPPPARPSRRLRAPFSATRRLAGGPGQGVGSGHPRSVLASGAMPAAGPPAAAAPHTAGPRSRPPTRSLRLWQACAQGTAPVVHHAAARRRTGRRCRCPCCCSCCGGRAGGSAAPTPADSAASLLTLLSPPHRPTRPLPPETPVARSPTAASSHQPAAEGEAAALRGPEGSPEQPPASQTCAGSWGRRGATWGGAGIGPRSCGGARAGRGGPRCAVGAPGGLVEAEVAALGAGAGGTPLLRPPVQWQRRQTPLCAPRPPTLCARGRRPPPKPARGGAPAAGGLPPRGTRGGGGLAAAPHACPSRCRGCVPPAAADTLAGAASHRRFRRCCGGSGSRRRDGSRCLCYACFRCACLWPPAADAPPLPCTPSPSQRRPSACASRRGTP